VATVIAAAMFCGCGGTRECEAVAWVSCNTNINVCMLVNCFCAIGGCAIAGGKGDSDGDICGCDGAREGETVVWVSCLVIML